MYTIQIKTYLHAATPVNVNQPRIGLFGLIQEGSNLLTIRKLLSSVLF